jgi:hypothetical protein
MRRRGGIGRAGGIVLVAGLWFAGSRAWSQTQATQAQMAAGSVVDSPASAPHVGSFSDPDTSVSFIDTALPLSQIRLRYDDAFRNRRPTRAEFFFPKGGFPGSPGPRLPETNVDYQDLDAQIEYAVMPAFSVFFEAPWRFVNPDINPNGNGIGDLNTGFKWAFVAVPDLVASFQFRTYIPTYTGAELGTKHVSLEPALLANHRLADWLTLEGEFRWWVPVGGTDFAGDFLRYGLGLAFGERGEEGIWLKPVVEMVGWTVLHGRAVVAQSATSFGVESAKGDTILNAKLGVRAGYENLADWYFGYGRALTGDTWYKDIFRMEFRWFY